MSSPLYSLSWWFFSQSPRQDILLHLSFHFPPAHPLCTFTHQTLFPQVTPDSFFLLPLSLNFLFVWVTAEVAQKTSCIPPSNLFVSMISIPTNPMLVFSYLIHFPFTVYRRFYSTGSAWCFENLCVNFCCPVAHSTGAGEADACNRWTISAHRIVVIQVQTHWLHQSDFFLDLCFKTKGITGYLTFLEINSSKISGGI